MPLIISAIPTKYESEFHLWIIQNRAKIAKKNKVQPKGTPFTEQYEWLDKNDIDAIFDYDQIAWHFWNEEDGLAFKLRFGT